MPESLFPQLDIWSHAGPLPHPAEAYGPNGDAVVRLILQAMRLDHPAIERVGSLWSDGNGGELSRAATAREAHLHDVVDAAARRCGREAAVRTAFLDGQAAVLVACHPAVGALEFWWNNYPEVPTMYAAGAVAATEVVAHLLADDDLAVARSPWNALRDGLPPGHFGPNSGAVAAILDAIPLLTLEEQDRIVTAWIERPAGDLTNFGYPGALHPNEGLAGWMPTDKGRRHLAWIEMLEQTSTDVRSSRRLEIATFSARMRCRVAPDREGDREYGLYLIGALKAAVAATLLRDAASDRVVSELLEAWESRS